MLSKVNSVNFNNSFTAREKLSTADNFISASDKLAKKRKEGGLSSKYLWSSTAIYPAMAGVLGYEFYNIHKISKLEKAEKFLQAAALKNSFLKKFALVALSGIGLVAGLQYLFNKNSNKKYENIKKYFNEINTQTGATIEDEPFRSGSLGAAFNPISGKVSINRNLINDPLTNRKCKKLLKHELVHARQFETIARMDEGIEKLNYATMKRIANKSENPIIKNVFIDMYNDIKSNPGKYEDKIVKVDGADVNFKDYITSIHTLLTNKDATDKDIPMVINRDYYENVRAKKGPLTPEETQKAQQYYQAQIDYPNFTIFQALNPFSKYYNNLLEKEAYKENPGFMGFIRRICGKD